MKNEHLIWAYGDRDDGGGQVVIIGLTDEGLAFLAAGSGTDKKTLLVNPPWKGFANVSQIVFFHEKDKATLKRRLHEAGLHVSEVHWRSPSDELRSVHAGIEFQRADGSVYGYDREGRLYEDRRWNSATQRAVLSAASSAVVAW